MGPITDLIGTKVTCVDLGNAYTWPLGYIIVWVQVDGVQGYDEDQIALVVLDESKFMDWIPIILGTPTISCIVNIMKEKEIDALATPWANVRVRYLLSMHRATATMVDYQTLESANPNGYDEVVFTRNTETIEAFSSHIISIKMEKAYTGEHINIMTQALWTKDGSLAQGLTIQNMYTDLQKGSKNMVMVVRNSMAYTQMLWKEVPVARAVAVTAVPEMPPEIRVQQGENGHQDPHPPNLTTRQRQGKLFEELDLSRLNLWSLELAEGALWLLAKYHNVSLLEPVELGCSLSTEHMIKVTDDTSFKEWFRWIPLPLVEEVWSHLREVLESGAIQTRQSAWCNAMVLVRKKDGDLWFCINFHCLNHVWKRTPTPCQEFRRCWRVLWVLGICCA